jgi:hypothetical protein
MGRDCSSEIRLSPVVQGLSSRLFLSALERDGRKGEGDGESEGKGGPRGDARADAVTGGLLPDLIPEALLYLPRPICPDVSFSFFSGCLSVSARTPEHLIAKESFVGPAKSGEGGSS